MLCVGHAELTAADDEMFEPHGQFSVFSNVLLVLLLRAGLLGWVAQCPVGGFLAVNIRPLMQVLWCACCACRTSFVVSTGLTQSQRGLPVLCVMGVCTLCRSTATADLRTSTTALSQQML